MKNNFKENLINHKFIISIAVIVLIAIFAFGFIVVKNQDKQDGINLYFLDPVGNSIAAEQRAINVAESISTNSEKNEVLYKVLDEIIVGPKNSTLSKVLPDDIKILSCEIKEDDQNRSIAEIDFSSEYNKLSESQELISRGAVTKTLTGLDFVDGVNILVEGQPITRTNGQTIGEVESGDLQVNPSISPYRTEEREVILYFSDEQAMGLLPEKRVIEVSVKQTIESRIVEELIKGPKKDEGLYAVIPPETKINNINTEGGICYVDFSGDFISKHSGGSSGEMLTIYSIVDSLTELENVKQVQFLIDGVKVSSLSGHFDFSKTFERKEDIILNNQ